MEREALQMCLEYIETNAHERKHVRHAIQAALAQLVQEPVAWRWGIKKLNGGYEWRYTLNKTRPDSIPLYAAPQKSNI
jgi:hypothetical protein